MTLSTHVLDLAAGTPGAGIEVDLYRFAGDARERVAHARTDADGRIDSPFGGNLQAGVYELIFHAAGPFFGEIPVRFTIADERHYHVPLLLSPWGYSTYRGS